MKPILILLPTLNRTPCAVAAIESMMVNGTGLFDVLTLSGVGGSTLILNQVPKEMLAAYQVVGLFADDVRMRTPEWDKLVLSKLEGKSGMVWGRDGIQNERLPTHPFVTSDIFVKLGFIQPPTIHHYYGDQFLRDLLCPIGRGEFIESLFTEHLRPENGKAEDDATYRGNLEYWAQDGALYAQFCAEQMGPCRWKIGA